MQNSEGRREKSKNRSPLKILNPDGVGWDITRQNQEMNLLLKTSTIMFLFPIFCGMSLRLQAQTTFPCEFKYGSNEADSIQCIENVVLFNTEYEYDVDRYMAWQEAIQQCPCSWSGLYGAKAKNLLIKLIRYERDSAQIERYIDTLLWIPMALHTYFPELCSYRQAFMDQTWYRSFYRCNTEEEKERTFQDFTNAINMESDKVSYKKLKKYMEMAYERARAKNNLDVGESILPTVKSVVNVHLNKLKLLHLYKLKHLVEEMDSLQSVNDNLQQEYEDRTREVRIRYPDHEWCEHAENTHVLYNDTITSQMDMLTKIVLLKNVIESNWTELESEYYFYDIDDYLSYSRFNDFEEWWTELFAPLCKEVEDTFAFFENRKELLKRHWEVWIEDDSYFDGPGGGDVEEEEPPVHFAEKQPEFYGGMGALQSFIRDELRYPQVAKDAGVQGVVAVQFIVEKNGCLSNFKILTTLHPALDEEAIRVCKLMPKWKPGETHGQKVRVYFRIPVKFSLD